LYILIAQKHKHVIKTLLKLSLRIAD